MKKTLIILTGLILCLPSFAGCNSFNNGIKPSKNFITREYKVTEFDKISASTVANIYYTQSDDNSTSVKIYGPDNIVDLVEVSITKSTLVIKMKKKNISNTKGMKVFITAPDLKEIAQKGVGNFIIEDGIKTESLLITSDGVGNMNIKGLKCQDVVAKLTGVGNIVLSGETTSASLTSDGVGNLKAENLISNNTKAFCSGVGNLSCHATKSLSATSTGIGNIRYGGNPEEKNINKSGIGSIKQL